MAPRAGRLHSSRETFLHRAPTGVPLLLTFPWLHQKVLPLALILESLTRVGIPEHHIFLHGTLNVTRVTQDIVPLDLTIVPRRAHR